MGTSPAPGWARTAELVAVGFGAARHLAEHVAGAGRLELAHSGVNALAVGRDPGGGGKSLVDCAPDLRNKKELSFQRLSFGANFLISATAGSAQSDFRTAL